MKNLVSINYALKITLKHKDRQFNLEAVLELLEQIQKKGNIQAAASLSGFSYRKAWDLLKQCEALMGEPLVEKQQGKGSQLTKLGEILLETVDESYLFINDSLSRAERKANEALSLILSKDQTMTIVASDLEKLERLRQLNFSIDLHIDGSVQALSAYAQGACELAGFHIAAGKKNKQQLNEYCQYIDSKNDRFVLLQQRQQGLMSHPKRPVESLQQMFDQQLVFVNRQQGSGTRFLLDSLLEEQNIPVAQLPGYYHEEHTHLAVASMVCSRQADAGFGVKNVADRLMLNFVPFCSEFYFLVFKSVTPNIQRVLNSLTGQDVLKVMSYKQFVTLVLDK